MEIRVKQWKQIERPANRRRWILLTALVVGLPLFVLLPLVIALLVVLPPSLYHPAVLDYEQRSVAAKQFYRKMMDFDDLAQSAIPFEFTFTDEQVNRYLASLDEIVALLPEGQAGRVQEMMRTAGLRDPAVALERGRLIMMVRADKPGLVVSVELIPALDAQGRLVVRLAALRLGRFRVPQVFVRGPIHQVRDRLLLLRAAQREETDMPGGLPEGELGDVAAKYAMRLMVGALDGQPIEPEGRYRGRRLRLTGIDIGGGQLTVHVAPVPRPPPQPADSQTSSQASPAPAVSL